MPKLSPKDRVKLVKQLALHEGRRRYPYRCTAGKLSVGGGYNLDDRGLESLCKAIGRRVTLNDLFKHGLSDAEIDRQINADIVYFEDRVIQFFPEYETLDPIRQRVVVDFAYNLGKRALGFTKAIGALKRKDYTECAFQMMHSLWASQVGDGEGRRFDRADRLCEMMKLGEDYKG